MTNIKDLPLSHSRPSDTLLDAMTFMRVASQILSEGDISDEYAAEVSWLLGSHKKRLEPVMELIELLENAGAIDITPEAFRPELTAATGDKADLYTSFLSEAPGGGARAGDSDAFAAMIALGLKDPKAMLKAVKAEKARRQALEQAQEDLALIDEIGATRAKLDDIRKEVSA